MSIHVWLHCLNIYNWYESQLHKWEVFLYFQCILTLKFNVRITHTYLDSKTWCAVIVHYYIIALKLCSTSFQLMQGKNQLRPTQISTLQNEPGLLSFFVLVVEKNNALCYWQSIINVFMANMSFFDIWNSLSNSWYMKDPKIHN